VDGVKNRSNVELASRSRTVVCPWRTVAGSLDFGAAIRLSENQRHWRYRSGDFLYDNLDDDVLPKRYGTFGVCGCNDSDHL